MNLVSGLGGALAPFVVFTIDPKTWGSSKLFCMSHLGCAIALREDGLLATCSHMVQDIDTTKEMIIIKHPAEEVSYRVLEVRAHKSHDFAILKVDAKFNFPPSAILGELPLAVNVFAYGYFDHTIEDGEITIIPQVYSGTITATPRKFKRQLATKLPFYQISFPSLKGFSGSPLFAEIQGGCAMAGMIFGNESSQVLERYVTEYHDGSGKVIEKAIRVIESGVAHTCETMKSCALDLGIPLWGA